MKRPDTRPMHRLPVLEAYRASLETCVFCPKLCRSACPVSNAERTETLTPWGKMSSAYFVAHGDVKATESFARTSLACTGCHACQEMCDHKNDVASTLFAARSAEASLGILPVAATKVARAFPAHSERTRAAVRSLSVDGEVRADASTALLVGCTYANRARPEAQAAVHATTALLGAPVALTEECCGLPLLHAGDAVGFAQQAARFADKTARHERVVVGDPGCAAALRLRYPEVGAALTPRVELLVEVAAREISKLATLPGPSRPLRYHDPCQLGRGLGIYEAPRRVLAHVTGRAPDEFVANGASAACSGGGGLLPVTMRETSDAIARSRHEEHESEGGGEIVTACASSLLTLRRGGSAKVTDLVQWIARAAPPFRS